MKKTLIQSLKAGMLGMGLVLSVSFLTHCSKTELSKNNSNATQTNQNQLQQETKTSTTNQSTQTDPCGGYYSSLSGKWINGLKGGGSCIGKSARINQYCEHTKRVCIAFEPDTDRCKECGAILQKINGNWTILQ